MGEHIELTQLTGAYIDDMFGGKAAGLIRAINLGLSVPSTVALKADRHSAASSSWHAAAARTIQDWAKANSYHNLVVRSSAVDEDSKTASHAGIYVSCFTVPRIANIENALRKVCAGMQASVVEQYRRAVGMPGPLQESWGVLIQPAIEAVSAGVAFVRANIDGLSIEAEAGWGLATRVVRGEAPADRLFSFDGAKRSTVRSKNLAIYATPFIDQMCIAEAAKVPFWPGTEIDWADAKVLHLDDEEGLAYLRLPSSMADAGVFTAETVEDLRIAGALAARALPAGADIEWVRDQRGELWITQLRSISSPSPLLDWPQGIQHERTAPSGRRVVQGEPAAPGIHTGPLLSPNRYESDGLRPVLWCGSAAPDLIPALLQSGSVISSDAGVLSHVAILARELGIPCVVGVNGLLDKFEYGTMVTVDGAKGLIVSGKGQLPYRPRSIQVSLVRAITLFLSPTEWWPDTDPDALTLILAEGEWLEYMRFHTVEELREHRGVRGPLAILIPPGSVLTIGRTFSNLVDEDLWSVKHLDCGQADQDVIETIVTELNDRSRRTNDGAT